MKANITIKLEDGRTHTWEVDQIQVSIEAGSETEMNYRTGFFKTKDNGLRKIEIRGSVGCGINDPIEFSSDVFGTRVIK